MKVSFSEASGSHWSFFA
uniref:Uncharacterized protein n=1 Tax=Anguilla anguilla TaxID=7936 RepID=A0A0E9RQS7_ANGAN